jgi:outer membrane protein OmpA-like peptidoglycan-associated protein
LKRIPHTKRIVIGAVAVLVAACTHRLESPREFVVFFETDQAALTPEAQQVIGQVADNARELHPSKIVIAGRADGGTAHDATLADQRAIAVMQKLTDDGLVASLLEKQSDAPRAGASGIAAHQVVIRLLP